MTEQGVEPTPLVPAVQLGLRPRPPGEHHHAIPWEKLTYDKGLGGCRTDITAEQVRGAPAFYGDGTVWPDRERENSP